jgi:hypothetical protein
MMIRFFVPAGLLWALLVLLVTTAVPRADPPPDDFEARFTYGPADRASGGVWSAMPDYSPPPVHAAPTPAYSPVADIDDLAVKHRIIDPRPGHGHPEGTWLWGEQEVAACNNYSDHELWMPC